MYKQDQVDSDFEMHLISEFSLARHFRIVTNTGVATTMPCLEVSCVDLLLQYGLAESVGKSAEFRRQWVFWTILFLSPLDHLRKKAMY